MIKDCCVVEVVDGNVADALKRLKTQVEASGIMREIRKTESFAKPSVRRVTKSRMARAKARKAEKRQQAWRTKQSG